MSQKPKSERKAEPFSGDRRSEDERNKKDRARDDRNTPGKRGMPLPVQGDEDEMMDAQTPSEPDIDEARRNQKEDYTG